VTGLPFVTLKIASTLDGKVAARDGSSRWITGEDARADVHRLRAGADAILVGAGTAVTDDPVLTVRDTEYRGRPPLRVLVDASGRTPPSARILSLEAPTLIATTERCPDDRRGEWREAGAEVVVHDSESGRVPLAELMSDLGKRSVQGLLVEGGPTVAWSFVSGGLLDKVVVYLAPKLVGGADAPSGLLGEGVGSIGEALELEIHSVERVGRDVKVEAYVHRDR
jgi:diaminohydroxyphosphoribosylaminopyrimidine deaminase/5-amino-6-(5-phosphoribosylamino)uracil reductase